MTLKELPKTVVHCTIEDEYDRLMRIYEDAGWHWQGGQNPTDENERTIVKRDYGWDVCICVQDQVIRGRSSLYQDARILSLREFLREQGIEDAPKPGDWVEVATNFNHASGTSMTAGRKFKVVAWDSSKVLKDPEAPHNYLVTDHGHCFRKCNPPKQEAAKKELSREIVERTEAVICENQQRAEGAKKRCRFQLWDRVVFLSNLPSRPGRPAIPKGTKGAVVRTLVYFSRSEDEYEIEFEMPVASKSRVTVYGSECSHLVLLERKPYGYSCSSPFPLLGASHSVKDTSIELSEANPRYALLGLGKESAEGTAVYLWKPARTIWERLGIKPKPLGRVSKTSAESGSLKMTVELSPNGHDWFAKTAWGHPNCKWQSTFFDSPSTSFPHSLMDDAVRLFKRLKDAATLSKEEKKLRKVGFKTDCSTWSDEAVQLYVLTKMEQDGYETLKDAVKLREQDLKDDEGDEDDE